MAKPFTEHGYTKQQAHAIHHALIQAHLKPDIRWDRLLDEITHVIHGPQDTVLFTGDIARRLQAFERALQTFMREYEHLGGPLQLHLQRYLFDHFADDPAAPDDWTLPKTLRETLNALQKAKRPPFDIMYAYVQERGARKNTLLRRLVMELLSVFEQATGIPPTVYASSHANDGYGGTAVPFLFACLAPLTLMPHKPLRAAILAVYKEWKTIRKITDQQMKEQLNALTQASQPPTPIKK